MYTVAVLAYPVKWSGFKQDGPVLLHTQSNKINFKLTLYRGINKTFLSCGLYQKRSLSQEERERERGGRHVVSTPISFGYLKL
jgi:hypothetical protein